MLWGCCIVICWAGVRPLTSVTCVWGTPSGSHDHQSKPWILQACPQTVVHITKKWDAVQWKAENVSALISICSASLQSWVISVCIMQQSFKGTLSRFFAPGFLITACNRSKLNPRRATITTFHFVYNEALVPDKSTQLLSMNNKRIMLTSTRHSELDKREGRNSLLHTSLD